MLKERIKVTYQSYLRIFSGERWEKLSAHGCKVQRPLWASTSNKTEGYSDVRYFNPLIGPDTVNTLPEETIEAIKDHGKIIPNTILKNVIEADEVLKNLSVVGIDMNTIYNQLIREGIEKFVVAYDKLISAIKEKA